MNGTKNARTGIYMMLAVALVSIKRLPVTRRLSSGITTLALVGLVLLVAAGGASADDCYVGAGTPPQTHSTIAAAVADSSCDNIYVRTGTYNEWGMGIDRPLSLIGDGAGSTIVDGTYGTDYIFSVNVDNVDVTGFTLCNLQDCSSGVMKVYGSDCNISYNDINLGQAFTFYMASSTHDNILKGNSIHNASCGCMGMCSIRGENHVVTDNILGVHTGGWYNNAVSMSCTDSLIYNNQLGTALSPSPPTTANIWNTTYDCASGPNIIDDPCMGGNYYVGHSCADVQSGAAQNEPGSDGICDDPYGADQLPLTPLADEPDLVIGEMSIELTDDTFEVTYTVCNYGSAIAGASVAGISIDGVHQVAHDVNIDSLDANTCTDPITVGPFDCPCGTEVDVEVCADVYGAVEESDESNNCTSDTVTCSVCQVPDLVINNMSIDLSGNAFDVTYEVCNDGAGGAGASVAGISIDGEHQVDKDVNIDPLDANTCTDQITVGPFDCPCDTVVEVTVCADIYGAVEEGDETNNCTTDHVQCPGVPHGCYCDDGYCENVGREYFTCGEIVDESCTFDADMLCPAGHGLTVGADGITIDGNGSALIGSSTTCVDCWDEDQPEDGDCGILSTGGHDDVVITDLEVQNFCNGIVVKGAGSSNPAENNIIEGCSVHDNGADGEGVTHGIYLLAYASDNTVTKNDVYSNTGKATGGCALGGSGIKVFKVSHDNYITCNNIHSNEGAGFYSKRGCEYGTVAYNEIWNNGVDITQGAGMDFQAGGIRLECKNTNDWTVEYNDIHDNIGPGVFVRGKREIIRHNTITGSINGIETLTPCDVATVRGCGIIFHPDGGPSEAYNNTFCNNEEEDVYVCPGHTVSYDDNTCDDVVGDFTCEWDCNNLVSVYYDFDDDTYYSEESCSCGDAGSCCNPGLFAEAGTSTKCAGGVCSLTVGNDPNDCNASIGPQPEKPDLVIEDIRAVRWCCCCIPSELLSITDKQLPKEEMEEVLFLDDPEMAKELGDEKLRKEVAEVLAKDPKLAEKIAAELAGDDKEAAKKLSDPKLIAERCCCKCNAFRELAGLLGEGIDYEQQQEMSDLLYDVRGGCCCDCCLTADCCCCRGRVIIYKIANEGDAPAGYSLSNLTVDGVLRSVDIVRPLNASRSRWEVFWFYRLPWWGAPHEVEVCADVLDWVDESNEDNNCRTEWFPPYSSYFTVDMDEYNCNGAVADEDPTGMCEQIDKYVCGQGTPACAPIGPDCLPMEIAKKLIEVDPNEAWYITDKPVGVIIPCPK